MRCVQSDIIWRKWNSFLSEPNDKINAFQANERTCLWTLIILCEISILSASCTATMINFITIAIIMRNHLQLLKSYTFIQNTISVEIARDLSLKKCIHLMRSMNDTIMHTFRMPNKWCSRRLLYTQLKFTMQSSVLV